MKKFWNKFTPSFLSSTNIGQYDTIFTLMKRSSLQKTSKYTTKSFIGSAPRGGMNCQTHFIYH
jgi:hypothetical protein